MTAHIKPNNIENQVLLFGSLTGAGVMVVIGEIKLSSSSEVLK
jgi:hypothetical protein